MTEANRDGPYIIRDRFKPEPKLPSDESWIREVDDSAKGTEESETGSTRVSSEIQMTQERIESPEELAETIIHLNKLESVRPQHKTETFEEWLAKQLKRGKP